MTVSACKFRLGPVKGELSGAQSCLPLPPVSSLSCPPMLLFPLLIPASLVSPSRRAEGKGGERSGMDPSHFSLCVWCSLGAGKPRHKSTCAYFLLDTSEQPCGLRCVSSFDFQWALGAQLSDSFADPVFKPSGFPLR